MQARSNAFVALCNFDHKVRMMKFSNCDLFKRIFTNKGIGYNFNSEREEILFNEKFRTKVMFPNTKRNPSLMRSSSSKDSLRVVLEINAEEAQRFEKTKNEGQPEGNQRLKPRPISINIHNPKEIADVRSKSFQIPLGYSTIVYIHPSAREIDEFGKKLTETQRNCRLDTETGDLEIFRIYTRSSCLFECKMKYAVEKCGCQPWNYPLNSNGNVRILNTF